MEEDLWRGLFQWTQQHRLLKWMRQSIKRECQLCSILTILNASIFMIPFRYWHLSWLLLALKKPKKILNKVWRGGLTKRIKVINTKCSPNKFSFLKWNSSCRLTVEETTKVEKICLSNVLSVFLFHSDQWKALINSTLSWDFLISFMIQWKRWKNLQLLLLKRNILKYNKCQSSHHFF